MGGLKVLFGSKGAWKQGGKWRIQETRFEKNITPFKHSSVCGRVSISTGRIRWPGIGEEPSYEGRN